MSRECEYCGLSESDLPEGVDPDRVFADDDYGAEYCEACIDLLDENFVREPTWVRHVTRKPKPEYL